LPDASLDGLNAAYANVGFIGFSLSAAAFGAWTLTPATLSAIITVCVLFAIALALVEAGGSAKASPFLIAGRVAVALARNPLALSPILGLVYAASGLPLFDGPERFRTLLANAASPYALVSLELFLGEISSAPNWTCLSPLVVLKLVGQPLLTCILARFAFGLAPNLTSLAVVLAGLPPRHRPTSALTDRLVWACGHECPLLHANYPKRPVCCRLLHAGRLDRRRAFQALQPRNLRALLQNHLPQRRHLAQQLEHQRLQLGSGQTIKIGRRRHAITESQTVGQGKPLGSRRVNPPQPSLPGVLLHLRHRRAFSFVPRLSKLVRRKTIPFLAFEPAMGMFAQGLQRLLRHEPHKVCSPLPTTCSCTPA
jgi:hypothetical protein